MSTWTVREMHLPASLDAPDAWELHGAMEAEHETTLDTWGNLDLIRTAAEVLAAHQPAHQRYVRRTRLVAVTGDPTDPTPDPARVLGTAALFLPLADNTHTGHLSLSVRPGERRRGIGSALHDAAVEIARTDGRTTLTTSTDQGVEPPAGPGTIEPSTGSGRVAADDPAVRFALARGFALEQVARYSVLDVPLDPAVLAEHRATAEKVAGGDYRVLTWGSRCPDEWVDELAVLEMRMSTDAPAGGLDLEEDRWDAERIRSTEADFVARGIRYKVAAVEHVPSGTLAGFSAFLCLARTDEFVHQHDTLVLAEHRGRRLGMLVKAANLERLAVEQPATRRIGTWNAEENASMLGINVALGFRPAGGAGEWQKRLG